MPAVIIGHTTENATKIWVRGDRWYPSVSVSVAPAGENHGAAKRARLRGRDDYTAVFEFDKLLPARDYGVRARFKRPWWWLGLLLAKKLETGQFRTAPPASDGDASFSFLLGSCNLSNIKINNLIGMVVGMGGLWVAQRSLRRPSNEVSSETFLWTWFKRALVVVTKIWGWVLYKITKKFRQPAPPLTISPFVRLSALLGACELSFEDGQLKPAVGTSVVGERSGAAGIVVFEPVVRDETAWPPRGADDDDPKRSRGARGTLVIVRTNDTQFITDSNADKDGPERLVVADNDMSGRQPRKSERRVIATVLATRPIVPRSVPSFMLHAGDQIYFDFPEPEAPKTRHYRYVYREAWLEDRAASHFLSQCPQYMTLDDHELLNNFANDEPPEIPLNGYTTQDYARAAIRAYREYVHGRHPALVDRESLGDDEPLYYSFSYGAAHFLVLDTRTERYMGTHQEAQMISSIQLEYLKKWLLNHRNKLVFVVTSVPFVPDVFSTADEGRVEQDEEGRAITKSRSTGERRDGAGPGSRTSDKWSADIFARQREAIIRHIHEHDIRRVVFLAGDMHCCYHATMKIQSATRCVTIHELGAGPIYQLRYGQQSDFREQYRGVIESENQNQRLEYRSQVQQFYGLANAVMKIEVGVPTREEHAAGDVEHGLEQTLKWGTLHTIALPPPRGGTRSLADEPVMAGEIHFFYRENHAAPGTL